MAASQGFLRAWLRSGLAALAIGLALVGGGLALLMTPREEEPQIDVPVIDVLVRAPGLSSAEVERRIVWPMEQTLYATSGVEYVYSSSFQDGAVITVRFYVEEQPTASEVKVRNRLARNRHRFSPELASYQIRPVYVDDVPFMTLTLHSEQVDDARLLSSAEELLVELTALEAVGLVFLVGGRNEGACVELDPQRMAAHGVTLEELHTAVREANTRMSAGELVAGNRSRPVDVGPPLRDVADLSGVPVARVDGRQVLLGDVAEIVERPLDPTTYTFFANGPAATERGVLPSQNVTERGAVTIALAKRPGADAVTASAQVRERLADLEPRFLGDGVEIRITRDYGRGADHAVDWLVFSLLGASLVVIAVLAAALGVREALIVGVSLPVTFAVALLVNFLVGYTLNRVTLFALIVALGLIVDDSTVSIDNIHRYLGASGDDRSTLDKVRDAVVEVVPPMVLTTIVVVFAFIPLAFVTGLMGPYMAPMAFTVPVAMVASTVVATLIVPWLAWSILGRSSQDGAAGEAGAQDAEPGAAVEETGRYRIYERVVGPLLDRRERGNALIVAMAVGCVFAITMPFLGWIPLKLLPYDDAEELEIVVDLPEGAPLEETSAAVVELSTLALRQAEVEDLTAYVGDASPVNFNGLVRGYYLREGPNIGHIRLNVMHDSRRAHSSHQLALRLLRDAAPIAEEYDASVDVVERPPGPPVLAPVVAEVRGQPGTTYAELRTAARTIERLFREHPGMVGVDTSIEADAPKLIFEVDRQKAASVGASPETIARLVRGALHGADLTWLREAEEIRPRPVRVRLPRGARDHREVIEDLPLLRVADGTLTVGQLGSFRETTIDQTIERKNVDRVIYVTGTSAETTPVDAVFAIESQLDQLRSAGEFDRSVAVAFDGEGEWFITRRAFRDLGIALGVALLAIYALLVYETASYVVPLILLISMPLTLVGVMPGFWLLNALLASETAGYTIGIPFTATGMIGIVALAGIAVRNAILLIDFARIERRRGASVRDALLRAGALRTRPILLTAGTAMLAVVPIAFDPVFAGLAWSLIFGLFVSTLFTLMIVPTLYARLYDRTG